MTVNGEKRPHRPGLTMHALLNDLRVDPRSVVVMREEEIYKAGQIPDVPIDANDTIEIVTMMQGG